MQPIEALGLNANQWQFLSAPDKYVATSTRLGRKLVVQSTRRQFLTARDILARLNGSCGEEARRGILLADDVGLGKTAVAALVAWVVASAGELGGVRILAPNDVVMRRWVDELQSHVGPLQECAPTLDVRANRVKARRLSKLSPGSIQVVKHSYAASDLTLACDLLIIDEAHRAKGEKTAFSKALNRQKKHARRVLILTATPFSIHLDELQRMLTLIGGEAARGPVGSFDRALKRLYSRDTARRPELVGDRLATKAMAAVKAISPFVIRHGIDDLPKEHVAFGDCDELKINVPAARDEEVELMLRMERAISVAKKEGGAEVTKVTNDPRFHVGWRHFDSVRENLERVEPKLAEPVKALVENQVKSIKRLRGKVGVHSKMAAVAEQVKFLLGQKEKVVLFCHHHATAQELTVYLASVVPRLTAPRAPAVSDWRTAWYEVLPWAGEQPSEDQLRDTFIEWLCTDLVRAQTWSWIPSTSTSKANLVKALKRTSGRNGGRETIAEAALRLYDALVQSRSSRAVLKEGLDRLPGANGSSRVLGVCNPSDNKDEEWLFLHNQQPDTIISIFNSPFGPDVLVVTDKLSEGIDLHRYCRHLIHYELDPSPIRTVQRNGRLRRVNSWAAATRKPILYAYPAFGGTRDHRLVQIMKKRIASFSLLLGGVQDFDVDEVADLEEKWRMDVIAFAKDRLAKAGSQLRAREPGPI